MYICKGSYKVSGHQYIKKNIAQVMFVSKIQDWLSIQKNVIHYINMLGKNLFS